MIRLPVKVLVSCFALAITALPASAQRTLELSGTAQSTCSLTSPVNGTIALDADLRNWATSSPATIVATNTSAGTYALTATRSNAWSASPTGTPSTTFTHTPIIASGANASAVFTGDVAKSTTLANAGVDNVEVRITASGGANPFRTGTHTTEVTVTCATP